LDVVAYAVDEEVGRGADAANGRRIAMAFALAHHNARNIRERLGEIARALVLALLLRHNRDGLRNVLDRRVGFGGSRSLGGDVADNAAVTCPALRL
jgi:hypothetical protein